MRVKGELETMIASAVTALGYELVGCEMVQLGGQATLRVYIDDEAGVGIDAIEKVSRQISAVMDVEEPIAGRYSLEVSSPGLDRPLFRLDDYRRFIGSSVKLRLRVPKEADRRHYSGKLVSVEAQQITLEMESGESIKMNFDEIEKANLIPEF